MAQLVIAAAGAAVGFAVGGPAGAQIGFAIGSFVGAGFGPTTKTQGPQLTDLKVTGTEYGDSIPWIEGHPRIAGQLIWASDRRQIATTTSVGKGGPSSQNTTYTYEVDVLYLLSDNVIAGVRKIFNNGDLIWSASSEASDDTLYNSIQTDQWRRVTVYTGAIDQLPDPTYEAAVGTANAPAYRARGTIFIEGLQLGSSGQIPNLTFEVSASGAASSYQTSIFYAPLTENNLDSVSPVVTPTAIGNDSEVSYSGSGATLTAPDSDNVFFQYSHSKLSIDDSAYAGKNVTISLSAARLDDTSLGPGTGDNSPFLEYSNGAVSVGFGFRMVDSTVVLSSTIANITSTTDFYGSPTSDTYRIVFDADGSTVSWYNGNVLLRTESLARETLAGAALYIGRTWPGPGIDAHGVNSILAKDLLVFYAQAPFTTTVVDDADAVLADVVSRLCMRSGLSSSQFDVTSLSTETRSVRALAIPVGPPRATLDILASVYFFECSLTDKLYFRARGADAVATLPFSALGVSNDASGGGEPFSLKPGDDLELPAVVTVSYIDVDVDYSTQTQSSDRLDSTSKTTSSIDLALGLTASEAKGVADTSVLDQKVASLTTSISLFDEYAELVPTDVVIVTGRDGSTFRMRLVKQSVAAGIRQFDLVLDDASVLSETGITMSSGASSTDVVGPVDTDMKLLDIPILRDSDDGSGIYVATRGRSSPYPGSAIFESANEVDFSQVASVGESAVFGKATTTLGNFIEGNIIDETNSVTVNVCDGTLSSSTRDAVLNDATINAMLIGTEIIRFISATLVSAGVYVLRRLLRGQRGTEWATNGHAVNEDVVLLRTSGIRRVSHQTSELGLLHWYKGVTLGRTLSTADAVPFTDSGVGLKPFSPFDIRGTRSSGDITLTWQRRTRLSVRTIGSMGISIPLGEESEAYSIDVFADNTFAVVKRTMMSAAPALVYSSAHQVTDFGSAQSTVYVGVQQISAAVGSGYPQLAAA